MANKSDEDTCKALLEKCRPGDFDGHTDFEKLSPVDKLHWLSTTAVFIYSIAKTNPELGCVGFFTKMAN